MGFITSTCQNQFGELRNSGIQIPHCSWFVYLLCLGLWLATIKCPINRTLSLEHSTDSLQVPHVPSHQVFAWFPLYPFCTFQREPPYRRLLSYSHRADNKTISLAVWVHIEMKYSHGLSSLPVQTRGYSYSQWQHLGQDSRCRWHLSAHRNKAKVAAYVLALSFGMEHDHLWITARDPHDNNNKPQCFWVGIESHFHPLAWFSTSVPITEPNLSRLVPVTWANESQINQTARVTWC